MTDFSNTKTKNPTTDLDIFFFRDGSHNNSNMILILTDICIRHALFIALKANIVHLYCIVFYYSLVKHKIETCSF